MSMDDIRIPSALSASDLVREHRGLPPINPHKIEGFGADEAPVPEYNNPFPPIEHPRDPMEADFHDAPSPLIPTIPASPWIQPTATTSTTDSTTFTVAQRDYLEIWYQGSKVAMSDQLHLDVERLILQGLQKEIAEKLSNLKPRRKRERSSNGGASPVLPARDVDRVRADSPAGVVAEPQVKRKGRPKGSLNKKTLEKLKGAHVPVVDKQAA